MDLNNLKDHIKDIELDFDQNEVWANIQREQKKEKKKVLFWWSSIFLGLLFIVGIYHVLDSTLFGKTETSNQEVVKNISSELRNSKTVKNDASNDFVIIENEQSTKETIFQKTDNSTTIENITLENTPNNLQSFDETTTNNMIDKVVTSITNLVESREENLNSISIINQEDYQEDNKEGRINNEEVNHSFAVDSQTKSIDNRSYELFVDSEVISGRLEELILVASLPSLEQSELDYEINVDAPTSELTNYLSGTDAVETMLKRKVSFLAIAEYGKLQRTLKSNNGNSLALSTRQESETVLDHSVVGLQINIPMTKQFFIATGIEYNRLTTKLEFGTTSVRPLSTDDFPDGLQGVSGFVINNSNSKYYNHIDLVNIPVLIGAKWNQSRWSETLSVGTTVNLHSSSRQLYLDEWNSLQDNSSGVKSKFNNSYILRAGLGYNFWSQFEWSIYASYRYTPNVMNNESNYSQSYQSYLLGTGIRYGF